MWSIAGKCGCFHSNPGYLQLSSKCLLQAFTTMLSFLCVPIDGAVGMLQNVIHCCVISGIYSCATSPALYFHEADLYGHQGCQLLP